LRLTTERLMQNISRLEGAIEANAQTISRLEAIVAANNATTSHQA